MPEPTSNSGLSISLAPGVAAEIASAVGEGLRRFSRGGVEVGGVLFGRPSGQEVLITAWRPIPCEHAFGQEFRLSRRDMAGMAKLLTGAQSSSSLDGLEPAGWFVSRTHGEANLRTDDIEFANRFFPSPGAAALVLQPKPDGSMEASWFIRGTGGAFSRTGDAPNRAVTPPVPDAVRVRRLSENGGVEAPQSRPLLETSAAYERPPSGGRWLLTFTGFALLAVAAVFGFDYARSMLDSPEPAALPLEATARDGQLRITWDGQSAPVRSAERAVLEVKDGDKVRQFDFKDGLLRGGSISYVPQSGEVDVRMTLYRTGHPPVVGYTRFLSPARDTAPVPDPQAKPDPVPPPAPVARPEDLERISQLEAELTKLRAELATERGRRAQQEEAMRILRQRLR